MTLSVLPEGARLDPRNRGFEWTAPSGPYRRIDAEQVRAWSEEGFFLLPNVFDREEFAELVSELDALDERVTAFLKTRPDGRLMIAEDGNITFMTHAVLQSPAAKRFCAHPLFQDLGHDLIGPDVRLYWDQGVYKKPEKPGEFPWHQDNGYTYVEPQQYLTCWVALNDATIENGCPWVVPGVHRFGTLEHWPTDAGFQCLREPEDAIAVEAPAGSIVVFSSLTPHATGPNNSSAVRKAYIVQFAPDGAMIRPRTGALEKRADDPARQYPILVGGEPVKSPA